MTTTAEALELSARHLDRMMGVDRGQLPWQRNLVGVLLEGVVVCLVFRTEITELLVVLLSAILQLILIEILMLTMTLRKGRSIKVVL